MNISNGVKSVGCTLLLLLSGTAIALQDAPAGKMLAEPYYDKERELEQANRSLLRVSEADFRQAYETAGKPKLVMLLGQSFDGMVSDWHAQKRVAINSRATGTEGTFVPESQSVTMGIEQRQVAGDFRSPMLTPAQWDEYERGFQGRLLQYGVRLVNRNVAMRLLDSEIREQTQQNATDDQQRLEMDMLRKHTQLLIEVMPYREQKYKHEPIGYQVTMTRLTDATLMASERIAIPETYTEYRAGASGYAKQRPQNFAGVEASSGGYEIIENPNEIWAEQGELAAEALLQMLFDRYL